MDLEGLGHLEGVVRVGIYALAAAVGLLILLWIIRSWLYICRPNEVLIFSGRKRRLADGTSIGYRVIFGGRA